MPKIVRTSGSATTPEGARSSTRAEREYPATEANRQDVPPVVEVNALTKWFGAVHALRGVDLTVRVGSIYGVLGPNGAGKTTLLRTLLGLVRPDGGSVDVLGHRPGAPAALRRTGALIESPSFVPHLSGLQNLRVLARARDLPDAEVRRVLEIVELDHRADERYAGYSLGMGQRLGVAAALLGSPSLLILDEPTNGLDPEGVASTRGLIRGLGEEGITVLLSSHLLAEVQQICDRVVVLNHGQVIAEDSVSALRERTGLTIVDVWASPAERVHDVLREVPGGGEPTRVDPDDDPHWRLEMAFDAVPGLIRILVEAGLEVHEIRRERPSLEDVFFSLTHSERTGSEAP